MHEIRVVAGKRFDDVSSPIVAAVPSSLFRCQHFHEDHQSLWKHAFRINFVMFLRNDTFILTHSLLEILSENAFWRYASGFLATVLL